MVQNVALDIAIGLALMYLVLSLACTVINEYIATKLNLRADSLAAGLQEILDDPAVRNAFYDHGLIAGTKNAIEKTSDLFKPVTSLMKGAARLVRAVNFMAAAPTPQAPQAAPVAQPPVADAHPINPAANAAQAQANAVTPAPTAAPPASTQGGDHPSYLSADTFVLALVGSVTGTRLAKDQKVPSFAEVQSAIEALQPSKVKSALIANLMAAQGDFAAFRKNAAAWFDDSMERLSGAYKRHLKFISIIVGFIVAVTINADTFAVGYALWSNPALRTQMAAVAADTVQKGLPDKSQPTKTDVENAFKTASESLRPMLPIGWPISQWLGLSDVTTTPTQDAKTPPVADAQKKPATKKTFWERLEAAAPFLVVKIPGWFVTALALSLGAPFWFDMLSKIINIRGAGTKPDRADAKK